MWPFSKKKKVTEQVPPPQNKELNTDPVRDVDDLIIGDDFQLVPNTGNEFLTVRIMKGEFAGIIYRYKEMRYTGSVELWNGYYVPDFSYVLNIVQSNDRYSNGVNALNTKAFHKLVNRILYALADMNVITFVPRLVIPEQEKKEVNDSNNGSNPPKKPRKK
jgi:hypothetical protein